MNKGLTALLLLLLTGTIAIVNLPDDCGYMEVVDDVVIIYTNCKVTVAVADVPSMDVIDGVVYLELPEGVAWRVIPQE